MTTQRTGQAQAAAPQIEGMAVLRQQNRRDFLRLLAHRKRMRRSELATATGLTGAAVSRISRELISAGLVIEGAPLKQAGNPGRRSAHLMLNPDGGAVLAITLSANRLQAALCRLDGSRIAASELSPTDSMTPDDVLQNLIELSQTLLTLHTGDTPPIAAGISVALASHDTIINGHVDSQLLGWQGESVGQVFQSAFHCPVTVESRPTGLLRAEINAGHVRYSDHALLVNVGVGFGVAKSYQGQLQASVHGGIGSLAHLRHPDSRIECECGRIGCLQQCGSGVAVVHELNLLSHDPTQPLSRYNQPLRHAFELAEHGDSDAKRAFHRAGQHLAVGLDAAQALLDPHYIILAGEAGRQVDFVAGVHSGLADIRSPLSTDSLRISQVTSDEAAASIALDAHVLGSNSSINPNPEPRA